jgi:hypothetical protein
MVFDRRAGGHEFDLIMKKCAKCGMTREDYEHEERGNRPCTGRSAAGALRRDNTPHFVPDDPLEDDR